MTGPRIRWTAGDADGIAHAHIGPRGPRTACGDHAIDEQHGWPIRVRCVLCAAVVMEMTQAKARNRPATARTG